MDVFEEFTDVDIIYYAGEVNYAGYSCLSELIEKYKTKGSTKAYFLPVTGGGDPNAGFRISRALGHHYPDAVKALIPSFCKSAGTLMVIGASELIIADRGELGPLDIQLNNKEEFGESSSGLDIIQAISSLRETVLDAFKDYMLDLKIGAGLSTKLSTDIAAKMATSLVAPIASQIDPTKLGEHQRALRIATAYGARLNDKFKNTTADNINKLLTAYPTHGFVIDRKEASKLFSKVRSPNELEEVVVHLALKNGVEHGIDPGQRAANCGVFNLRKLLEDSFRKKDSENKGVNDDGGTPDKNPSKQPAGKHKGEPKGNPQPKKSAVSRKPRSTQKPKK